MTHHRLTPFLLLSTLLLLISGCGSSSDSSPEKKLSWYQPGKGISWQWQLQGDINSGYDVDLYDIDLFDTDKATIASLQSQGRKVICYFSAGSYEPYRTDANQFDLSVLGKNLDGFAEEKWLDIRSDNVLAIMKTRLDLAVTKGCDGVEPDNVDGFDNDTGFPLTAQNQLDFNRALAQAAHQRELAIALKNDLAQITELVDDFDMALNEECFFYNECDLLLPFIAANKPVFIAEYDNRWIQNPAQFDAMCEVARNKGFNVLVFSLDLNDSLRMSCP